MAAGISRSSADILTDDNFITPFFTDRPDRTPVKIIYRKSVIS
jgi:hypothetical protein